MTTTKCDFEVAVVQACRSGSWSGPLKEHLAECDSCREATLISQIFQADRAEAAEQIAPGLSARKLWLLAEYEVRLRNARRRPWVLTGAAALGLIAAALVAMAFLPSGQGITTSAADISAGLEHVFKSPLVVIAIVLLMLVFSGDELQTAAHR